MLDVLDEQWLKKRIKYLNTIRKFMPLFGVFSCICLGLYIFYSVDVMMAMWKEIHDLIAKPSHVDIPSGIIPLFINGFGGFVISLVSLFVLAVISYFNFYNEKRYIRLINELGNENPRNCD